MPEKAIYCPCGRPVSKDPVRVKYRGVPCCDRCYEWDHAIDSRGDNRIVEGVRVPHVLLESELNEIRHAVTRGAEDELQAARAEVDAGRKRIAELAALLQRMPHLAAMPDSHDCLDTCPRCAWERMKGGAK